MAGLAVRYEDTLTPEMIKFGKIFPELARGFLSRLGWRIHTYLKDDYLSGQELNLNVYPKDRRGHHTISYTVNRRISHVKVFSYPINLFEKGRSLRGGGFQPAKKIIPKLRRTVQSRLSVDVIEIGKKTFERDLRKRGF